MKPGASEDSLERACEGCIRRVREECRILETLVHENIIRIKNYGFGIRDESLSYFVFMELASGGELFDKVKQKGGALPEDEARGYARQLLAGVAHCHSRRVAHLDIKLENVVLTSSGVIKIIDFGLSHVYNANADGTADRSEPLTGYVGTRSYMAPEVLSCNCDDYDGDGYDGFAADVWSTGCSTACLSSILRIASRWSRC